MRLACPPCVAALIILGLASLPDGIVRADEPAPRTVSLTGTATVKAVPDEVAVSFGVETRRALGASARRDYVVGTSEALKKSSELLAEAQAGAEESVKRVKEALKGMGIEERHIRTDSFQVQPDTWNDDGVLYFRGYLCRNSMSVVLKDTSKADACVDTVLKNGATHVYSVSFESTQIRKWRDEARKAACKAAREKADLIAGELGAKVKRVLNVSEGSVSVYCGKSWGQSSYRQSYQYAQNIINDQFEQPSSASDESGELSSGDVAISASVSVVFELE